MSKNFFVDLVLKFISAVPAPVIHNVAKSFMLKMVFWHLAVDQVKGAYVEFGVASGNSMKSALLHEKNTKFPSLGIQRIERNLYGFDTFSEFKGSELDNHPIWSGNKFSFEYEKVKKRFKKCQNVFLYKQNAMDLEENLHPLNRYIREDFIAVCLMDMDLGEPTRIALEWIYPKLTSGSFIIFDEYSAYRGDPNLGEQRAFKDFLDNHPNIKPTVFKKYGDGGVAFIIHID